MDPLRDRIRSSRVNRYRTVPDRSFMELDLRALRFHRRLLPRDLRQRLQPGRPPGRTPYARFEYNRRYLLLCPRDEPAAAGVRFRRMDRMGSALATAPPVRVLHRHLRILHARA